MLHPTATPQVKKCYNVENLRAAKTDICDWPEKSTFLLTEEWAIKDGKVTFCLSLQMTAN